MIAGVPREEEIPRLRPHHRIGRYRCPIQHPSAKSAHQVHLHLDYEWDSVPAVRASSTLMGLAWRVR